MTDDNTRKSPPVIRARSPIDTDAEWASKPMRELLGAYNTRLESLQEQLIAARTARMRAEFRIFFVWVAIALLLLVAVALPKDLWQYLGYAMAAMLGVHGLMLGRRERHITHLETLLFMVEHLKLTADTDVQSGRSPDGTPPLGQDT